MSNFVTVTIRDHSTRKEMGTVALSAVPSLGEHIYIDGIKYWIEKVEWKIHRNTVYKDQFAFEGVDVFVDTAMG
jgi:hypothetical protein